MKTDYDVVVVGAGPAGLSCSTLLSDKGLDVAVLDEQKSPGGQIYRNIEYTTSRQRQILGEDYTHGLSLVDNFSKSTVTYVPRAQVWQVNTDGNVFFSKEGTSQKFSARYVVLATGAMERPVPFPGWTLPGVMTCGGMSNLYKDSGLVPQTPVVIAGSGPLLWLIAEHMLHLNAPIEAILDTNLIQHTFSSLHHLPKALTRLPFLMKGTKMMAGVYIDARKKKIPVYRGINDLKAHGDDTLQRVTAMNGKKELSFDVSTLLVTEGIIPNLSLARQVGCKNSWDQTMRYWHPAIEGSGSTNLSNIFISGDSGYVHGALPAEYKGELTGLEIAMLLKRVSKEEYRESHKAVSAKLQHDLAPRPFIDSFFRPRKGLYTISDETTVCRCESVRAGHIRKLISEGLTDHNEIKAIIRCGMGPCQGRMCSSAIHELIAEGAQLPPEHIRQHRLRPPIKPVSLLELANAEKGEFNEN